jgi:hypothetical protein
VLVFACNTGTVHALGALRAEFEPGIPVVGTVPAIKPAAAFSDSVAIWATVATTASSYQRQLIAEFAGCANVAEVACPGLADAIHAGDEAGTAAAIAVAASGTPSGCGAVVLGCTEYELAAENIGAALPGVRLFGSAAAIATQALRRAGASDPAAIASQTRPGAGAWDPAAIATQALRRAAADGSVAAPGERAEPAPPTAPADRAAPAAHEARAADRPSDGAGDSVTSTRAAVGTVRVLLSGRPAGLPPAALRYPQGRLLAGLVRDRDVPESQPAATPAR